MVLATVDAPTTVQREAFRRDQPKVAIIVVPDRVCPPGCCSWPGQVAGPGPGIAWPSDWSRNTCRWPGGMPARLVGEPANPVVSAWQSSICGHGRRAVV